MNIFFKELKSQGLIRMPDYSKTLKSPDLKLLFKEFAKEAIIEYEKIIGSNLLQLQTNNEEVLLLKKNMLKEQETNKKLIKELQIEKDEIVSLKREIETIDKEDKIYRSALRKLEIEHDKINLELSDLTKRNDRLLVDLDRKTLELREIERLKASNISQMTFDQFKRDYETMEKKFLKMKKKQKK